MNSREGNFIHPTAIVHDTVVMGEGNHIGAYCVIYPFVTIGSGNRFEGHCSVGSPAEHKDYFMELWSYNKTIIGDNNVIREFTTINAPSEKVTQMGDNCIMLRGSHLSHDSVLEDDVTLSCNVLVGGHSYIMQGANLGLGCILHQRTLVGAYAMIGMGAVVTKTVAVIPGWVYVGSPARPIKKNLVGLKRADMDLYPERVQALLDRYDKLKLTVHS